MMTNQEEEKREEISFVDSLPRLSRLTDLSLFSLDSIYQRKLKTKNSFIPRRVKPYLIERVEDSFFPCFLYRKSVLDSEKLTSWLATSVQSSKACSASSLVCSACYIFDEEKIMIQRKTKWKDFCQKKNNLWCDDEQNEKISQDNDNDIQNIRKNKKKTFEWKREQKGKNTVIEGEGITTDDLVSTSQFDDH